MEQDCSLEERGSSVERVSQEALVLRGWNKVFTQKETEQDQLQ